LVAAARRTFFRAAAQATRSSICPSSRAHCSRCALRAPRSSFFFGLRGAQLLLLQRFVAPLQLRLERGALFLCLVQVLQHLPALLQAHPAPDANSKCIWP
jgi:hypothetical protein